MIGGCEKQRAYFAGIVSAFGDIGQGFSAIITSWEKRCRHIGRKVGVGDEQGVFSGLAPDGALLLKTANGILKPIYAGDVRVEYQPAQ